jgi:hypothetical protein
MYRGADREQSRCAARGCGRATRAPAPTTTGTRPIMDSEQGGYRIHVKFVDNRLEGFASVEEKTVTLEVEGSSVTIGQVRH